MIRVVMALLLLVTSGRSVACAQDTSLAGLWQSKRIFGLTAT